jgi:GAF domain-containing protein
VVVEPDAEVSRLRALLRDLVALSAIPGGWIGSEPRAVAAGLADALVGLLRLDFGFVRMCDPSGGDAIEVAVGDAWSDFPDWLGRHLLAGAPFPGRLVVEDLGDPGSRPCVGIAIPIGVNGEGGVVAAACGREGFPNENDQLLLSLAANQATVAFQSARLIFERTAQLGRSEAGLARLVVEQRALRRVAILAAHEASQEEIFTAIAESSGELLGSECSGLLRREADGSAVVVATWGDTGAFEVGARIGAEEDSVTTRVFRTGGTVRVDDLDEASGDLLKATRSLRLRSAVGTPVTVEGGLWGAIAVGTTRAEPMPPDTESRLGEFTELMATAIANSESRARADRLTDAQAALRRMAILVAEDPPLADVFAKATEEVAHLIGDVDCGMCRDEGDGSVVTVAASGHGVLGTQRVGERFPLDGISLAGRVLREGRYCQIDDYSTTRGTIGERGKKHGICSAAGCPIVVHARMWGMIGVARYDGKPLPPEAETRLAQLAGLVATAIANADARAEIERLAQEQAALRRVATLVAADPSSAEMFAKVAAEVTEAIGDVDCALARVEDDETITVLAASGIGPMATLSAGDRFRVDGRSIVATVLREGRACRIDNYPTAISGEIGERGRQYGIRSAAGCPIVVRGRTWGVLSVAAYAEAPLPPESERRVAQFTELVATAIANADARAEIERLAQEQAALRRVATLVAEQASSEEVFGAVVEQVGRLVDADGAAMARYVTEDTGCIVASWGREEALPVGIRFPLQHGVASRVGRARKAARIDDYGSDEEDVPAFVRDTGVRSAAGAPIVVAGEVWGALLVGSYTPNKWPPDAESKIEEFTQLAATAVSNMQARMDLAASRARIVKAADEARRRIERDLHDGIQQRLVSVALKLRATERTVAAGEQLADELAELGAGLDGVIEELRELSRGIHPAILREGGLDAAIRGLARRSGVPVALKIALEGRLPEPVEVATYYVISEALTNAAKHARASRAEVAVESRDGMLEVSICDDGVGGAQPVPGSGLSGLSDRVEAIGGTIRLSSPPGKGTLLRVAFPRGAERVDGGRDKQAERDPRRR